MRTSPRAEKDASEIEALVRTCQGLVRSIAWKIHRPVMSHVDLEDLISYGQVGVAEAARDYDASRGVQFTTFAYYRIRGAILDGLSTMSWFNRADYFRGRYERAANEVLGSSDEGDSLPDDARWFRQATGSLAVVYLMSQQGSGNSATPVDFAEGNGENPEAPAELADLASKLNNLITDLPEDAQTLVRGVYFEGLSIKEAGERVGISKAWASRMHSRALEKLAYGLTEYNSDC